MKKNYSTTKKKSSFFNEFLASKGNTTPKIFKSLLIVTLMLFGLNQSLGQVTLT